jgi:hypothetical protein
MACTTPQYLQIADVIYKGNNTANDPIDLPIRKSISSAAAPIEVWVRRSLVPERAAEGLKTIFTNPDQSAAINALALLPGTFGKEAAAAITTLAGENIVSIDNVGDWLVIDVNAPRKTSIAAAATPSAAPPAATRR